MRRVPIPTLKLLHVPVPIKLNRKHFHMHPLPDVAPLCGRDDGRRGSRVCPRVLVRLHQVSMLAHVGDAIYTRTFGPPTQPHPEGTIIDLSALLTFLRSSSPPSHTHTVSYPASLASGGPLCARALPATRNASRDLIPASSATRGSSSYCLGKARSIPAQAAVRK